jgi:hypothetical protein
MTGIVDVNIEGAAKEIMGGLDKLFTSDQERMDAQAKIMEIMQRPGLLMGQTTLSESQSADPFKSRWRPAIGWIGVVGLGLQFIMFPLIRMVGALFGTGVVLPELDITSLMALVMALLGVGGYRSLEKKWGLTQ